MTCDDKKSNSVRIAEGGAAARRAFSHRSLGQGCGVVLDTLVQPATHALNPELSQPRGVRTPLEERTFTGRRMNECANQGKRWKCRLEESVENDRTVSHPSHQP